MSTALSTYDAGAVSSTLSTSNQLYHATAGSPTTTQPVTVFGTQVNYIEIWSQGVASSTGVGSLPAQSGHGWFLDDTTLDGQDLLSGAFSGSVRFVAMQGASQAGSMTADIIVRVSRYRPSTTTYTTMCTMTLTGQTINATLTNYSLSGTAGSTLSFATGDKLYIDRFVNITAGSGNATQGIRINRQSSDTATHVGDATTILTTNGFQATSGGVSLAVTMAGVGTLTGTTTRKTALSRTLAGVGTLAGTLSISSVHLAVTMAGAGTLRASLSVPVVTGPTYRVVVANHALFVIAGTLVVTNTIGRRGSANFMAYAGTTATHFYDRQQVAIYDSTNTLAFSGYLDLPQEQKPGFQNSLIHTLQCIDQHWLADKRRITASYTNKTCGFIAQDIVLNILAQEGVSIAQIYDGLTPSTTLYPDTTLYPGGNVGLIPQATFSYAKVSDALDSLVTAASSSGVPYYWQIDQFKQLWFVPYSTVTGPTVDGTNIDQKANPVYVKRGNPTYRNTQYILGGVAQTVTQTEVRKGDGNTQAWTMGYALNNVPTITVNGSGKTVGIKGVDSGKNFYWAAGDPVVTQDSGGTKLISTDTLQVVYIGQYPSVIGSQDAGQVAAQQMIDGTSGIVEDAISDATLTSVGNGLTEASQLLTRYAQQGTLLQFSTRTPGYAAGQLITVNLPMHGLNGAQMLIENVQVSDQSDLINMWYQVTAIQGPYDTSWVSFFSKLLTQQAPANSINVGLSQSVTILASFVGNVSPSATLTASVFACPIPNTTLFPSTSLFPC